MTVYDAELGAPARPEHPEISQPEHPNEPQPIELPVDMRAPALAMPSTGPMLEVAPSAPLTTPRTPPVAPATSEPPHPSELRAKTSSPSSRKPAPREAPVQASPSEPPRPEVVSPPVKATPKKRQAKPTLQTPSARRYLTRSGGRPLQKRARVESLEPIDLTGQSPVPSPEPSPTPQAKPQASQPPPSEPQIQSETAPEVILRRPMLTQPPIEGNLDCRARPFHSELYFDKPPSNCGRSLKGHSNCCEDIEWSSC
ncbi:proteoglycan 4-like [Vitis riparia]|uniref:proteoglycan 4-like n=1 Tax=Vitis riparia TaxID=96939 RepID=UPI00155A6417|nr:proteoglycan 4-like [Vitis riparia]